MFNELGSAIVAHRGAWPTEGRGYNVVQRVIGWLVVGCQS